MRCNINRYSISALALAVVSIQFVTAQSVLARSNSDLLPLYPQLVLGDGPVTPLITESVDSGVQPKGNSDIDLSPITSPTIKNRQKDQKQRQQQFVSGASMLGVQLGPLQLRETSEEKKSKTVKLIESENVQLADLWDATLKNNQDIQFVVQRLMPARDPRHATASVTKALSSVMYSAVSLGSIALPQSANANGAINRAGVQMIQGLLNSSAKVQSKTPLSQTESIMLYNVVRSVAEKLVENFHDYKKYYSTQDLAEQDLADLQNTAGLTAGERIELEYFLRKTQREIVATDFDKRRARQAMIDLAGPDAVEKLDHQIDIEFAKLENGTEVNSQADSRP